MADRFDRQTRSRMMGGIRAKNTRPERVLRSELHRLGYRFRIHRRDLPGTPDIVFPSRRAAIFVHGCFWHQHPGCRFATVPASNAEFWKSKFEANAIRDTAAQERLKRDGWRVMVVWECGIAGSIGSVIGMVEEWLKAAEDVI